MTMQSAAMVLVFTMFAATAGQAANSQQDKMKACNQQAASHALQGDPRKAFMKTCLSAGSGSTMSSPTTPQERMKYCNAEAGDKAPQGDARKAFMKTCLQAH